MATISLSSELDVIGKYKELVEQSLNGDSVYIRTKETLQEMFQDGTITSKERSELLGLVLNNINNAIVSSSMSTALQWAAKEKDIALQKLELAKRLDILDNEKLKTENEANRIRNADLAQQAESLRQNGAMTVVEGKVVSLSNTGVQYENILLTREKVESENKAQALSDVKLNETNAGIHKIIADTYVNYGMYSGYRITDTGVTGIVKQTPVGYTTLSDAQLEIAKEQAKGYSWNAWSNAATGLGSTIGVALTSETDIFTGDNAGILSSWKTVINKLRDIPQPNL